MASTGCAAAAREPCSSAPPDYADERAAKVIRQCAAMGVALPVDDVIGVLSGWEPLIQLCGGLRAEGPGDE
jgi:hypothetical protein